MYYSLYFIFNFILYSFLGWILEEVYCFCITQNFKEEGFLIGPFKPMYGFAMAILINIYTVFNVNKFILGILFFIIPTFIEYLSGVLLKKVFNKQYWDYRNNKFNFRGLICFKFSIYWGILSGITVIVINPIIYKIYSRMGMIFDIASIVLLIGIIIDFIFTIKQLKPRENIYEN